ncbi:MAG: recombinase family protein [Phenylobacterium sp.]|uniref:recombinase family protein n=1 Tax=Phenylobacterium sp. TaxID=1871053 RepID=UPI00391B25E5
MSTENTHSGAVIGYGRTSTADQHAGLDDQIAELKAAGCTRIFSEQVSSVDAARPQLQAALQFLRDGDEFVCTKPDRLARSTTELLRIVEELTQRGVRVRLLSMNIDTNSATGKLLLTLMGAVASFEREIMLERQRAGIAKAKAEGKFKGRAPTARAKAAEVHRLVAAGCKPAEIMKLTNISRASFYRIAKA